MDPKGKIVASKGYVKFNESADLEYKKRVQETLEEQGITANFRDYGNGLSLGE